MRHYQLVLETKGPVHIGDGKVLGKKDYYRDKDGSITVLDPVAFTNKLSPEQLDWYCRFLEQDAGNRFNRSNTSDLGSFIHSDRELLQRAHSSIAYRISGELSKARRGSFQYHDVHSCVKDAHYRPYIPGSSVKGMLRTALLVFIVLNEPEHYRTLFKNVARNGYAAKNIADAAKQIEHSVYWVEDSDPGNAGALRDIMHYLSVSDSEPLQASDLVFAKKYDLFSKNDAASHKRDMGRSTDYNGNSLDVYRESIRPGAMITVSLDIDERIDSFLPFPLDKEGLHKALDVSNALYKECFLNMYDGVPSSGDNEPGASNGASDDGMCHYIIQSGPFAGKRCRNHAVGNTGYCKTHQDKAQAQSAGNGSGALSPLPCYLGGGVGYSSKTIVNAILKGDSARVNEIAHILYEQFPSKLDPSIHKGLQHDITRAGFRPKSMRAQYRNGRLKKGKDDHRHWEDPSLGVSPHTLKLGIVDGKKYQMGLCDLRIEERK